MMKMWLVFAGLKLVELGVIVFAPWAVGYLICKKTGEPEGYFVQWSIGLMLILGVGSMLGLLLVLGFGLVGANLEWAKSIVGGA